MTTTALLERQRLSQNLGITDRQTRAVIGTLMLAIPMFSITGTLGLWSISMLASIPVLVTAIIGWDPLYAVMGKSTYQRQEEDIQQLHWSNANMSIFERGIRLGIGIVMVGAMMAVPSMSLEMAFGLLAIPLIATAITAWDPLYAALSMNSFGSKYDVEAAEPGINENTLAEYYEFPQPRKHSDQYSKAA
jgi:membrane protein implicated in regulation of membrane protease activity